MADHELDKAMMSVLAMQRNSAQDQVAQLAAQLEVTTKKLRACQDALAAQGKAEPEQ